MNTSQAQICRDALTGTGAVIIAAAFLAGVYFPGRARTEQTEKQLALGLKDLQAAPRHAAELEQLRSDLTRARQFLAASQDRRGPLRTSDVIEFTAALGREAGISLVRLEPLAPELHSGRTQWPVEVVCEGTAAALSAFLVRLEDGPRLTTIHEVALDLRPGPKPVVEGRIRFSLYADQADSAGFAGFDASRSARASDQTQ